MSNPVSVHVSSPAPEGKPKVRSMRIERGDGGFVVHKEHEPFMESKPAIFTKVSHLKKHVAECFGEDE